MIKKKKQEIFIQIYKQQTMKNILEILRIMKNYWIYENGEVKTNLTEINRYKQ